MFRVIGGAVVYGLALYGVVKLLDRPKMVVIQPTGKQDAQELGAEAGVPGSEDEGASAGHGSESASRTSATADAG